MIDFNNLPAKDKIYYQEEGIVIYYADCREILPDTRGISAVVTDPPYGLGFMNKEWDNPNKEKELIEREKKRSEQRFREGKSPTTAPFSQSIRPGLPIGGAKEGRWFQEWCYEWAKLLLNVCLPGAMLLSFGATRTSHRLACAIEDAGWQIRDTICWVYGSGFPKSLNIGKAIDKLQGNKRKVVGEKQHAKRDFTDNLYAQDPANANNKRVFGYGKEELTKGTSEWEGYGTALKPAYEPIILAMNPIDGTFANNVLKYGVAGLNIDECRIPYQRNEVDFTKRQRQQADCGEKGWTGNVAKVGSDIQMFKEKGRFPANFIHDGSQEVMELFPETGKSHKMGGKGQYSGGIFGGGKTDGLYHGDSGSAARFFYCAKASRAERDAGLNPLPLFDEKGLEEKQKAGEYCLAYNNGIKRLNKANLVRNNHPTVKPLALMEYLVKLVKMPEYNLILDPFCGSGTTLLACIKLGIPCIGIDNDEKSCEIAAKRCLNQV